MENNGYANVKTVVPDMENSHVIAAPDAQVTEKFVAPVEEANVKKMTKKLTTKKAGAKKWKEMGLCGLRLGKIYPIIFCEIIKHLLKCKSWIWKSVGVLY